jgi:TPR repeat protein
MYERGAGVPADLKKAADTYRKACDMKDQEGCVAVKRLQP